MTTDPPDAANTPESTEDDLDHDPGTSEPENVTAWTDPQDQDGYDAPLAPRPINWRTLSSLDAEHEWLTLNEWVTWLRIEFGLSASVIPPMWHRHPELVWELSALHLRWLGCYHPDQDAAAPLAFMTDFHAARTRLREWVQASGTRLDRDRPTRITTWPGEPPAPTTPEQPITDRDADFVQHVLDDVTRREKAENAFLTGGG